MFKLKVTTKVYSLCYFGDIVFRHGQEDTVDQDCEDDAIVENLVSCYGNSSTPYRIPW